MGQEATRQAKFRRSGPPTTDQGLEPLGPDDPLRLSDAARIAFPLGGITVSGLRKEAARGRLAIERIAGKDFTTLTAIENMRMMCRFPSARKAHEVNIADRAAKSVVSLRETGVRLKGDLKKRQI